jgi:hypothetical protein
MSLSALSKASKSFQLLTLHVGEENVTKSEEEFNSVLKKTFARMNTVEKQLRRIKLITKRHDRSLRHLQHFIMIKIIIANQDTDFDLVIDNRETVEYLAHLIEAEYTHRFVIPVMTEDGECNIDSLSCGALYDSEKNLIRFSEVIADVLDVDSEVLVINTNHGRSHPEDLGLSSRGAINSLKADEMLQRIFRNKIALEIFHDYCVEAHADEHFLFWIAIASFEDIPQKDRASFSKFIFKAFIDQGAPLRINVGNDILNEIKHCYETSESIEKEIFDEAQEEVYALFVSHIFSSFEKSPYMEALKHEQEDRRHYRKAVMFETIYDVFKPNMKDISEITSTIGDSPHHPRNYGFRHQILQKSIKVFFPQSKYCGIDYYFSDSTQLTLTQRKRQINKGKKIGKCCNSKLM